MTTEEVALARFAKWYCELSVQRDGSPARGTVAAALVVLEHLRENFDLRLESHRAPGGAQIKGAGGAAVRRILARFDEDRQFVKEGGRTNRGGPGSIASMLGCPRWLGSGAYRPWVTGRHPV